jgi:hypothetical protein
MNIGNIFRSLLSQAEVDIKPVAVAAAPEAVDLLKGALDEQIDSHKVAVLQDASSALATAKVGGLPIPSEVQGVALGLFGDALDKLELQITGGTTAPGEASGLQP